ncbi:helix-turn-helix domain-containing protein [Cohnella suwonensis]|uniref:Helix-turn-helix domain-containing protein n=1 Tax=Cohnella suwonensis TaxID=696072 RepID=A0ABW0LUA8_9BACL
MKKPLNLLTLHEAADLLQISRTTLNRWRKEKGLPFIKIGKDVFIDGDRLAFWVQAHSHTSRNENQKANQPQSVTIGYQKFNAHLWSSLIIKELKWLESELSNSPSPVPVHWYEASNGPKLIEEMIAGRIQIASIGDYPLTNLYKINMFLPNFRAKLLAFDGKSKKNNGISLVVSNHSSIHDLSNLSSYSIATLKHSSTWYRLYKSLGAEIDGIKLLDQGLNETMMDIHYRQIDAGVMCEPFPTLVKYNQTGKIVPIEGADDDYLSGIVAEDHWANHNNEVVNAYLRAHLKAHQLIRTNPLFVAKLIASVTDFPLEVVFHVLSIIRWDAAIYDRDLQTLKNIGMHYYPVPYPIANNNDHHYINDSFLHVAVEQLNLPMMRSSLLDGDWIKESIY